MIIPVYKPYGLSTHQLAQKLGILYEEKATHTGTLDPAAEGVVVVLTGEDRFKKAELADTQKIYQAQILLGISTDTHDLIGLITEWNNTIGEIDIKSLQPFLQELTGTYEQIRPSFSAKRIDGESYFDVASRGETVPVVSQRITINHIKPLSLIKVTKNEVLSYQESHLELIEGNFRQKEIAQSWKAHIEPANEAIFPVLTALITCSKRTYIRALVRDLEEKLGVPAALYSLVRTTNGPHTIADCICLV